MERIIKGDELMLFSNARSIAYATAHTLTINGNTIDISSKDHGFWGASEIGNITWEITSENLFTDSYYALLFDAMINKTKITVAFGFAGNYNINGLGSNADYTLDTSHNYYSGEAYVTSLTANANTGENSTFSITLTGCGALVKNGTSSNGTNNGSSNNGGTNSGSYTTFGNASYNNNVTINGVSYNVSGGSVTINQPLTSITVTGSNIDYVSLHYGTNSEDELSYNYSGTSASWTGNLSNSSIQVYIGNSDTEYSEDRRWFTINYSSSQTTTVSAPTLSGNTSFTDSTTVSMSATSGALIRYTTNGDTPTANSTLYSSPFTISTTTTIKAIAIKDGIASDVASKTYSKVLGGGDDEPGGDDH